MITGLSHITFISSDLPRMARLLTEGLGARQIYASGEETFSESPEAFFDLGGLWIAVMEGAALPTRSYNHVAFQIGEGELDAARERLAALGVTFRPERPRVTGEGRSLYFYDFDNHLFELHTGTLQERLARYARGRETA
ncbi:FosX/FosE/FosI family fosfomycin resistance hydrolase [Pseudoroseicyclus sp. CXY001]|uniref:FosX/FosE/FosI family fosfomycin resistance hydrolase n=1 Tax=Pseudoroseicyclus sp. CXY001 TaxID=3242492 RepID=UPI00358DB5A2